MTRKHKRARLAVPVRISRRMEGSITSQMACTLDVTVEGARLNGVYSVKGPGEVIAVERGKNKALFRVVWVGERGTAQTGQLGVQCIEPGKNIWEVNFVPEADEPYMPMKPALLRVQGPVGRRLACSGYVELSNGQHGAAVLHGQLKEISASGCYVRTPAPPAAKSLLSLKMRVDHAEVHVKATVASSDKAAGMWVEFNAIRRGDVETLQNVLDRLAMKDVNYTAPATSRFNFSASLRKQ
jgi:PilZ domain-containing protein